MHYMVHGPKRILSEQVAYDKLYRGKLDDTTGTLEHTVSITVTFCTLEY